MMNRPCLRLLAACSAAGCLMGLSAPAQAAPFTQRYSDAVTYGCDAVSDISPMFRNDDPTKGVRERIRSVIRAPSGSKARATGGVLLGGVLPLHVRAQSSEIQPGCDWSGASAQTLSIFSDEIEVTAGDLPVGTPVVYTATIDFALEMPHPGDTCVHMPFFNAYLRLSDAYTNWSPAAPFHGNYRMTVSKTTAVGDRLSLGTEALAYVFAPRFRNYDILCVENSIRTTDTARITLTADVPGANTTSVKGIRYGLPR